MKAIDRALVDEVWRETIAYPPERVHAEAQAFLERQPHAAAFSHRVMGDVEPRVREAALGLGFLLFKILERSLGRPFPPLAEARIAAAYETTRAWLTESAGADAAAIARSVDAPAHPSLITHILTTFYGGDGDPGAYDEHVKASLVLLLTTLTEALDLRAVEG